MRRNSTKRRAVLGVSVRWKVSLFWRASLKKARARPPLLAARWSKEKKKKI